MKRVVLNSQAHLEITIDKVPVHTARFGGYLDTEQGEFSANSFQLAEDIDERFRFTTLLRCWRAHNCC